MTGTRSSDAMWPTRERVVVPCCEVDGCDNVASHRGWCMRHYMKWYRTGSPTGVLSAAVSTRGLVKRRSAG